MKREEYLREVVASLKDTAVQVNIERELQGHIDDLVASFTEDGCSPEEAEKKAIDLMGNEEKLGYRFSRVYREHAAPIVFGVEFFAYLFGIFFAFVNFALADSPFEPIFAWIELFFVGGTAAFLAYGVKIKDRAICAVAAAYYSVYAIIRALAGAPFLLLLRYLLEGHMDTYRSISQTWTLSAGIYRAVSIAFFVLFAGLAFVAAGLLKVKSTGHLKRILTKVFIGISVLQLALLIVSAIAYKPYPSVGYRGFYLVDAEQMTEIESLDVTKEDLLEIDYDWGTNHAYSRSEHLRNLDYSEEDARLDDVIIFKKKLSAEMITSKGYMAMIPVMSEAYIDPDTREVRHREVLDYQNAKWFDALEGTTLRLEAHIPGADWMICEIKIR